MEWTLSDKREIQEIAQELKDAHERIENLLELVEEGMPDLTADEAQAVIDAENAEYARQAEIAYLASEKGRSVRVPAKATEMHRVMQRVFHGTVQWTADVTLEGKITQYGQDDDGFYIMVLPVNVTAKETE